MKTAAGFPWLCVCFAGASLASGVAMTLDEAGAALGNESFKVREEAEQTLRKADMGDYEKIERFARSDNPEVAARSRRSLPIVLLGVDDRFPPDLATKLRRVDDIKNGYDLVRIVDALATLDPPQPVTLIGLHSYWLTVRPGCTDTTKIVGCPLDKAIVTGLEQGLQRGLGDAAVLTELGRLHPDRYQAKTLAMVLNGLCKQRPDDLTPLFALHDDWTRSHPRLTELLNADGYRLVIAKAASKAPDRIEALACILNFATDPAVTAAQKGAVQQAIGAELSRADILTDLGRLPAERFWPETLAMVINDLCKLRKDDLTPVLALHEGWVRSNPRLTESLGEEGYRLELVRTAAKTPNRVEALRTLLDLATKSTLSKIQENALRERLATYKDVAGALPLQSLDQDTSWYYFNVFGANQLDLYRTLRKRFPDMDDASFLGQSLEPLMVLEKSGPGAAFDYALKQKVHGGASVLGEWLNKHPELIREPLPLPAPKDGDGYNYRTIKFFKAFAPYPDEAEMKKNPALKDAFDILMKDPGWREVAIQAKW